MRSQRWQQIEVVLQQALDLPSSARDNFIADACGNDEELRKETNSLIHALDDAGDFIEVPAITQDAAVILNTLPDRNVGRIIGSYTLVRQLGVGGMGEVYLAEDSRLGRHVAVKILPPSLVAEPEQLRRFQVEARAISALNHPNVLTIHEIGHDADSYFIATEFVDGHTVRELMATDRLTEADAVDICIQVGSALQAAHAAGIIHRDVKPENIMLRPDGLAKVLDFGIAKPNRAKNNFLSTADSADHQTEAGVIVGTVGYMSPEQARGLAVDERTDVWSLGVVLYEMIAKRPAFTGPTKMDTMACILEREPPSLAEGSLPATNRLHRIVEKSLRKDRRERYQTVTELLDELRSVQEELDLLLPLLETAVTGRPKPRYYSLTVAIALTLVLGSIALVWFWQQRRSVVSAEHPISSKLYRDMTNEERLAFIDQAEQRISAMMGDRPAKLNRDALEAIERRLSLYVARTESHSNRLGADSLNDIFQRAVPYVPLISKEFAAQKVPVAIGIYLPMIESEYHPCGESKFGAKGIFQFLPSTARQYGVAAEEMCDVNRMAPAAARYIADRMAELGEDSQSITLVLLSYNRGPEWVRDTLRELRGTKDFQRNFWTLFANRDRLDDNFRSENAGYVPRFFAAAIIGENPALFGLSTPPLSSLAAK